MCTSTVPNEVSAVLTKPSSGSPLTLPDSENVPLAASGVPAVVEQFAVPAVPSVCLEAIVGDDPPLSAGVLVRVRLFVSPVKPSATQDGAAELVDIRAVCACSVVPAPK